MEVATKEQQQVERKQAKKWWWKARFVIQNRTPVEGRKIGSKKPWRSEECYQKLKVRAYLGTDDDYFVFKHKGFEVRVKWEYVTWFGEGWAELT